MHALFLREGDICFFAIGIVLPEGKLLLEKLMKTTWPRKVGRGNAFLI